MTLPSSGTLSLQDIATEFRGSHPISLSDYYAGGAHVAAGTAGTNGPVPSGGQISVSSFYGTMFTLSVITVNVGFSNPDFGFERGGLGSLTPNPDSFLGTYIQLTWASDSGVLQLSVDGDQSSSPWATLTIGSNGFSNPGGSYDSSSNTTSWVMGSGGNPFGTVGQNTICYFT